MPVNARLRQVSGWLEGDSARLVPGRGRGLLLANALPHPDWLDVRPNVLTALSKHGLPWVFGALGAALLGVAGSRGALVRLVPSLVGAELLVHLALKRLFRRPRPLSSRVRQLVLRRAGWAFPSGDTAASFAGAWAVGRTWP